MITPIEEVITPRQLELLALYASGFDYQQIGEMKFLSPYTVRNTLLYLNARVGARNLTHLSVMCLDAGLIRRSENGMFVPTNPEGVI